MKALKVVSLIVMMALSVGALGALYVEGRVVYEILNPHTH